MNTDNGAISFTELLDNKQFIGAINESERRVKGLSDATVTAGDKIDKTFQSIATGATKSFSTLQDSSKREVGLIADIEKSLEQLKEKRRNAYSVEDIEKYNKKIQEAELNLKEYNQAGRVGIDTGKQQVEVHDSLTKSVGKWAAGLFTAAAALEVVKKIIASTESTTHAFEVVMAEAKSGVQYFFKAIASGDWTNFNKGMAAAIKGARDFVNEKEDIENRQNEQIIKNAETSKQIDSLRAGTFDKGIENNDKLITNLTQIIELEKQDYAAQAKIAGDNYASNLKNAALQSGMNKEKLDTLITEYTKNKEIIELGEKYNSAQARLRGAQTSQTGFLRVPDITNEIAAMGKEAEAAGKLALEFGKIPIPLRKALADMKADQIKLEGQAQIGSRRDENQLAMAINKKKAEEAAAAKETEKAAKEAQDLSKQIKEQQELLNQAISKGNSADIKAIGEKIAALQKELDLRERITRQVVDAMQFQGFVPTLSETGQLKEPVFGSHAKVKEKTPEQISVEMGKLAPSSVKWSKEMTKDLEDYNKGLIKEEELHKRIFEHAVRFTAELGRQMGLSEQQQQVLGSTLDMFTSLAEGGPAGYVGAAVSLFSTLMAAIPSQAAKFQAQIDLINKSLEKQQQLIALSARIGGGQEARQGDLDLLNKKKAANDAQMAKDQKIMNSWIDLFGAKERAQEDYFKRLEEGAKIDADILAAQQDFNDFITGGMTEMSIADSIAQGFQDGKSSAADFAETFNDFMRTAINSALEEASRPEIAAWYKKFAADMVSDGGLDPSEVADLRIDWDKITAQGKANRDAMYKIAGISPDVSTLSMPSSISGSIQRNITEDTGTELAGLMRKIADDNRMSRDYDKIAADRLISIDYNTANTVIQLQVAVGKLDQIVSNTKPVFSGIGG